MVDRRGTKRSFLSTVDRLITGRVCGTLKDIISRAPSVDWFRRRHTRPSAEWLSTARPTFRCSSDDDLFHGVGTLCPWGWTNSPTMSAFCVDFTPAETVDPPRCPDHAVPARNARPLASHPAPSPCCFRSYALSAGPLRFKRPLKHIKIKTSVGGLLS